ncbi:scarecrow-like protein 3 [Oryza glaberrima]|nr:scarecrow-like protein 3 [Oryza glaberrima]
MTNFQLFGSMVPVPVASMATATAPAAVAAADNGGHGSSSASQNASGSGEGQGGSMSLSLQLRPLGSTPTAAVAVSVPPMAAAPMMAGPAAAAPAPAPPLATMAVAQNASLAAVASALAAHRRNQATHRSAALHGHLRRCAEALAASRPADADAELARIARMASADGDAVQRVAAAFAEAMARVVIRPWRGVSAALFPSDAGAAGDALTAWEAEFARQSFLNLCPLLHLAAVAVNEIILETTRNDKFIHIVDLGGIHHAHWVELLQGLATRRAAVRPCLRLTIVHEHKHFLGQAAQVLAAESDRHGVPLDLHIVESSVEALKLDALGVRSDHAVVIVSTLQLHRLVGAGILSTTAPPSPAAAAAASMITSPLPPANMSSKVDRLLRGFHLLSPRAIILTENEANHFVPSFTDRFASALPYYEQLFAAMEEAGAAAVERKAAERYLLREEIKDVIACDHDGPRWAQHETLGRWVVRMGAAGFALAPAITVVTAAGRVRAVAARLPGGGDERRYGVTEGGGWLILNREEKPMFCVSAWRRQ